MSETKFTYKNTVITLSSYGDFLATVGGKIVRAASLDAMKKRIDKAAEDAFEPFYAMVPAERGRGLVRVKIVGRVHASKRDRFSANEWLDEAGRRYRGFSRVVPDTDAARASWARYEAAQEASEKADRARREAADAVIYLPWDYVAPKAAP